MASKCEPKQNHTHRNCTKASYELSPKKIHLMRIKQFIKVRETNITRP